MNIPLNTARDGAVRQYLTFTLDDELFGLDVIKVREVVAPTTVVPVFESPQFIRGVINLRGHVLPVLDLRLYFGMTATGKTVDTCVIVVEMLVGGQAVTVGVLADSVREVVDVVHGKSEGPTRTNARVQTDLIRAWARRLTTS